MNWKRRSITAVPVAFVLGSLASGVIAAWVIFATTLLGSLMGILAIMGVGGIFVALAVGDALREANKSNW
jgi:hypothetical protein